MNFGGFRGAGYSKCDTGIWSIMWDCMFTPSVTCCFGDIKYLYLFQTILNNYGTCIVSCQKNIFMQSSYCWQALHHWVVFRDTVGVGCECINSISNVCCAGPAINLIIITFCSSVLSAECAWKSSWVYSQHTQATHVEVTKSSQKLP